MKYSTKEEHLQYFRHIARTSWFKNHEVVLSEYVGDKDTIRVVRFRQPGTNCYAVRYVFDGNHIYVSGDLGCAVFECTWTPLPTDKMPSFWYLFEKCSAYGDGKWDYSDAVCKATLRDVLLEEDDNGNHTVYPDTWNSKTKHVFHVLLNRAENAQTPEQWSHIMQEIDAEDGPLTDIDSDYWEWMCGAGNVMPARMVGIMVGLQMVSEKLNERKGE